MYAKDGATLLADSLGILRGILARPVLSTNTKRAANIMCISFT